MATKTAEAHPVQYIDRVVPVDEELGDAEHAGSCCAKRHSDEKAFTDIAPDSVATIAVQTQTTENLADESGHPVFRGTSALPPRTSKKQRRRKEIDTSQRGTGDCTATTTHQLCPSLLHLQNEGKWSATVDAMVETL